MQEAGLAGGEADLNAASHVAYLRYATINTSKMCYISTEAYYKNTEGQDMRIKGRRKSLEACTESGWDAFDLLTEGPLEDCDIESLSVMEGSFLYMKQLKKPFFKIESDFYVIKGVKGDPFFRFAVHRDHEEKVGELVSRFGS